MAREAGRAQRIRPGHVFWLPRGATWLNRDKPRPFATAAASHGDVTLVYGSTQRTERQAGAACMEVPPHPTGVNRNGLRMPTLFYPGTLILSSTRVLPAHSGILGRSLDAMRAALRVALGIGQGACTKPGVIAGSRRGRIVELGPAVASHLNTALAIVLTEHAYSAESRYQAILPILGGPVESVQEHDLVIGTRSWHSVFPVPVRTAVLPIPITLSVWHPTGIARATEHVVDEDSLARIDRALCDYFALPDPPGG
jgi:hypothetical protein